MRSSVSVVIFVLVLASVVPCVVFSDETSAPEPTTPNGLVESTEPVNSGLPAGLSEFLDACLLEANGDYRDAMASYAKAHELNPDSLEIRSRFAELLLNAGMYERAVELLDGQNDLDYFGLRVYAAALSTLALQGKSDPEKARLALEKALEKRTDDVNLMMALVQIEQRLGHVEKAEAVLAELRLAHDGSPQLIAYHASLLVELGRFGEAAELFRECVDFDPTAQSCRENLVSTLIEDGQPGEAGEALASWLEDDDLDELVRAAALLADGGRPAAGLKVIERVLRVEPSSERARGLEAFLLSNLGRYEEAVPKFKAALKKDPENVDLLLAMAWATARLGNTDEAREFLGRAWEVVLHDSGSEKAMAVCLTSAQVELAGNHPIVAREWLDRVASPAHAGSDYVRFFAESFRQSKQYSQGVSAMLRLQPKLSGSMLDEARAFEGEFRIRLGDPKGFETLQPLMASSEIGSVLIAVQVLQMTERWNDVARETRSALERFPEDKFLLFSRAGALERLGEDAEAKVVFQNLLEVDPDNSAAANYLGYMWAEEGANLEEALKLILSAVETEPENSAYLDSLGWVYFRLGDVKNALHWLTRAVELGALDPTVLSHLGEVYLASGDTEEALLRFRQALDLGPEDPERIRDLIDTISNKR